MEEITRKRNAELYALGMKFNNNDGFIGSGEFSDFNFSLVEIKCDSREEWEAKINDLKAEINRRNSNK